MEEQEKKAESASITKVTVYTSKRFGTADMQGMGSDKFNPEPTGETFQKDGKTWGIYRVRRGKRIFYYLGDVHEAPEPKPRKNQQTFSVGSQVGIPVDVNSIIR
jgi:hypothetical protein